MTTQPAYGGESDGLVSCWCCGSAQRDEAVVRLGNHPEVALCVRCARFVYLQARALEDADRSSPVARARDVLRTARRFVVRRGWHQLPAIGSLLRRLGRHTP